jgi:hypothetical protein
MRLHLEVRVIALGEVPKIKSSLNAAAASKKMRAAKIAALSDKLSVRCIAVAQILKAKGIKADL